MPAVTNSRCRSRPLNPGKRTSSSTHAGASGRGLRRNSPAAANVWTLYPTDKIRRSVERRNAASSSMTITMGSGSTIPHLCLPQRRRFRVADDVQRSLDHFALKDRCGGEEPAARIRVIGAYERPLLASVSEAIGGRKCSNVSRLTRRGALLRGQSSRPKSRVTFSILVIFMPHAHL